MDIPDRPGVAAKVFGALGKAGINVDMIIQSEGIDKKNDISFTVSEGEVNKALKALRPVKAALEAKDLLANKSVAKVAVVGVGMRSHAGVASTMFDALADLVQGRWRCRSWFCARRRVRGRTQLKFDCRGNSGIDRNDFCAIRHVRQSCIEGVLA